MQLSVVKYNINQNTTSLIALLKMNDITGLFD